MPAWIYSGTIDPVTAQTLLKPALFIASLIPTVVLVYRAFTDNLGANPIEAIRLFTGDWTLYFLLITLAVTPLRHLTGHHGLIRYRRMLGLFAFYYAVLHVLSYIILDQFFNWHAMWLDVLKRPYITIGIAAFVLLIPLALTSTKAMMRRLGGRWQRLHQLIYPAAILGVLHYYWLVKADVRMPLIFAGLLTVLLVLRLPPVKRLILQLRQSPA